MNLLDLETRAASTPNSTNASSTQPPSLNSHSSMCPRTRTQRRPGSKVCRDTETGPWWQDRLPRHPQSVYQPGNRKRRHRQRSPSPRPTRFPRADHERLWPCPRRPPCCCCREGSRGCFAGEKSTSGVPAGSRCRNKNRNPLRNRGLR